MEQEMRELRWQNRQLRKTCGRQGQTIYALRAMLAEVRALNSKLARGELRQLERITREQRNFITQQAETIRAQAETIDTLKDDLALARIRARHTETTSMGQE